MFGLGGMEVLVILVVGVVVLGPERLPKVMRSFTRVMSEFRRVSTELQRTINTELDFEEVTRQKKAGPKANAAPKKKKKKTVKTENTAEAPSESKQEDSTPATDETITTEKAAVGGPDYFQATDGSNTTNEAKHSTGESGDISNTTDITDVAAETAPNTAAETIDDHQCTSPGTPIEAKEKTESTSTVLLEPALSANDDINVNTIKAASKHGEKV